MKFNCCLIALGFFLPVSVQALSAKDFDAKMRSHLETLSKKVTPAVRIQLLGSDRVLFSHNEEKQMRPASNAKLITTMAALETLGTGFTFETKVFKRGGDLVIAGNGDPYLVSERLWLLARDIARSGIKKVRSIRINNTAFERTYTGLREFEGSGEPFTALVSPTALNFNSLEVHVIPGPDQKARLEAGPLENPYAVLKNQVKVTKGYGKNITIKPLGLSGNRQSFLVGGSIGSKAGPVIVYSTVASPEAHFAAGMAALLRREGIEVEREFGGLDYSTDLKEEEQVAKLESLPLHDLVRLFNLYSNNFMTEEVFLALSGQEGAASVEKSKRKVTDFLKRHPSCLGSKLENGSGLHWDTRMSANCFVETIQNDYREFLGFADLLGSLPSGGQTGTLKHRYKRAKGSFRPEALRGKTGTLWSKQVVSSLVGVTRASSGEKIVFALIENDERNDPGLLRSLKDWEDRCLELIQQLDLSDAP